MNSGIEVLPAGERTLDELADVVRREHDAVAESIRSALAHAMDAGDALLEAHRRVKNDRWKDWLTDAGVPVPTANRYMRLAAYREHVMPLGDVGIKHAMAYLRGLPAIRDGQDGRRLPSVVRSEIRRLRKEGMRPEDIADVVGVSVTTAAKWADPEEAARQRARYQRSNVRRREAWKALQQKERERAARKAGQTVAEAYSLVRRVASLLDRILDESTEPEVRAAYRDAIAAIYQAEDKIARALKVE